MSSAVDLRSLGYRTDLALLELGGTEVEDRGDHLVVRTPDNPAYWWGNFLLLADLPSAGDTDRWLDRFVATFPEARHRTFGVDGTDHTVDELPGFTARGLSVEAQTVMTASVVHPPPRPNDQATYRPLVSDADWEQSVAVRLACHDDPGEDAATHRMFVERAAATHRRTVEAGHGAWFGAFVDGRLLSQMGMLRASPGLGRFQSVETLPEARGQGLAGTLVHHVSRYAFSELAAHTLVMVADPDYLAIRIYRAVGFSDTERQLQAERGPS